MLRLFRRDVIWNALDQMLAASSNIVATLCIGRLYGTSALGRFAVVFGCYLALLGLSRTFFGEPLLVLKSSESDFVRATIGLSGVWCVGLGCLGGVCIAPWHTSALALGPLVGAAAWQDVFRHVAFKDNRPRLAAEVDGVWLLVVGVAPLLGSRAAGPNTGSLLWAAGGCAGALVGLLRLKQRPTLTPKLWKGIAWPYSKYLAVDSIGFHVNAQLIILVLVAEKGEQATGMFRAAQVLLSPGNLLLAGAMMALAPRLAGADNLADMTPYLKVVGLLAVAGGGAIAIGGGSLIRALFGDDFAASAHLAPGVGAAFALSGLALPVALRLKARGRSDHLMLSRVLALLAAAPCLWAAAATSSLAAFQWVVAAQWGLYLGCTKFFDVRSRYAASSGGG